MVCVFPGDLWFTYFLQSLGDWLTPFMKIFTWLGYPQAYMIIVAVIYWSVDRKLGLRLAIFLPVAASLNSIMKQAFHAPRPYWLKPDITAIHVSNGFGMPSGHAQASTVWLYAASCLRRRWIWFVAIVLAFLVGLSRIYLGVHFASQVLAGWVIGILVIIFFLYCERKVLGWFLRQSFFVQLILICGISIMIICLGSVFVYLLQGWDMPLDWISNSADDLALKDESIFSSLGMGAVAGNAGGFLGVALGALLSHRRGGFDVGGSAWKSLLRSITGLIIFLLLYAAIMQIAPDEASSFLYSIWRFGGFFMLSFLAIFLLPQLFMRIKLLSA